MVEQPPIILLDVHFKDVILQFQNRMERRLTVFLDMAEGILFGLGT